MNNQKIEDLRSKQAEIDKKISLLEDEKNNLLQEEITVLKSEFKFCIKVSGSWDLFFNINLSGDEEIVITVYKIGEYQTTWVFSNNKSDIDLLKNYEDID